MKTTISNLYRSRIHFDVQGTKDDVQVIQGICDKALDFGRKLDECETNTGGPCWGAYIVAEHSNLKELEEYEAKVRRYIARRKGAFEE